MMKVLLKGQTLLALMISLALSSLLFAKHFAFLCANTNAKSTDVITFKITS